MNIYVYSDESGVFDKVHNDTFIFGGLIILGNDSKDDWSKRYLKAERDIRKSKMVPKSYELKATQITNAEKGKLFRSLNNCHKFCGIVKQESVLDSIFESKKTKQRYLDYVYKISVKRAFEQLILNKQIIPNEIENIYFFVDEHTTATNGRYELREGIEQELKHGTHNFEYNAYYPPIFPNVRSIDMKFFNSESTLLVRAADIVANRVFYLQRNDLIKLNAINDINLIYFP